VVLIDHPRIDQVLVRPTTGRRPNRALCASGWVGGIRRQCHAAPHLKSLDISLGSATEPIDDISTGKLMEDVLAAFAQFDNDGQRCRFSTTQAVIRS
jgi:hypothetical protein